MGLRTVFLPGADYSGRGAATVPPPASAAGGWLAAPNVIIRYSKMNTPPA